MLGRATGIEYVAGELNKPGHNVLGAAIFSVDETRWDEKAGLRRDAIGSQVIDALEGARDKGDRQ